VNHNPQGQQLCAIRTGCFYGVVGCSGPVLRKFFVCRGLTRLVGIASHFEFSLWISFDDSGDIVHLLLTSGVIVALPVSKIEVVKIKPGFLQRVTAQFAPV
jgi:hypothetical protein